MVYFLVGGIKIFALDFHLRSCLIAVVPLSGTIRCFLDSSIVEQDADREVGESDVFRYWILNVAIFILSTDIFITKRYISSCRRRIYSR